MIDSRELTLEQRVSLAAHAKREASKFLRVGDKFRVTKCPGTKRWATFAGFDGHWIVSKSGIDDYSPLCVDMVNKRAVDFSKGWAP